MLLKKQHIIVLFLSAALLMVSLIFLAIFAPTQAEVVSASVSGDLDRPAEKISKKGDLPESRFSGAKNAAVYEKSGNENPAYEDEINGDIAVENGASRETETPLIENGARANGKKDGYLAGEVIVKIDDDAEIDSFLERHRLELIDADGNTLRLKTTAGSSVIDEINELNEDTAVAYAEPNYERHAAYIPNDPYYNNDFPGFPGTQQWGPQKINTPGAWDISKGSTETIVAVIDTGVDYNHIELAGRVTPGWDYVNGDGDPMDDNGHGSHVAGIIAANGDNSLGIAGIDWNTKILALKVLNSAGSGLDFYVAAAIRYAADSGADVVNLSLAGSSYSQTLQDAVNYAYGKGVVVVAAAGNDGNTAINYPAGLQNVIGVGATDPDDFKAFFSNFNSSVDLSAPGVDILSLYLTALGSYEQMSGTSMAAPHVAGAAALLKSVRPYWSPAIIESRLEQTALDLGASGRDDYYGYGRIDIYQSVFDPPKLLEIESVEPLVYDPNIGSQTIKLILTGAANVYLRVSDNSGNIVRNIGPLAQSAGTVSINWDGKNGAGVLLPPSWYKLDFFAVSGNESMSRGITVNINYGQTISMSPPSNSASSFNPSVGQSVDISTTISRDAFLGLVVYNSGGEQIRVLPLTLRKAGPASLNWDGNDGNGNIVPPGGYGYLMIAIDSGGLSVSGAGSVNIVN